MDHYKFIKDITVTSYHRVLRTVNNLYGGTPAVGSAHYIANSASLIIYG